MKKIAYLFPGQGSQYVGMGKSLYDNFSIVKETFLEAEKVIGYDIKELCFNGPFEKLSDPELVQAAILTLSVAVFRVLEKETESRPGILIGHSFGELSALVCSGAINFHDALMIAKLKGQYVKEEIVKFESGMMVIKNLGETEVRRVCELISGDNDDLSVAMVNSPAQIVISGKNTALVEAKKLLETQGGLVENLRVGAPFHSNLLKNSAARIKIDIEKLQINNFNIPVYSTVSGEIYKNKYEIVENLSLSLIREVKWISAVNFLKDEKVDLAIELGPQKILSNLLIENDCLFEVRTFNKFSDFEVLKNIFEIDKKQRLNIIIKCIKIAVCTKNNNWDNEEYERGVIRPYQKTKERLMQIENDELEAENDDVIQALEMLDSVFATKRVENNERADRWDEVFSEENMAMRENFRDKYNLKFL